MLRSRLLKNPHVLFSGYKVCKVMHLWFILCNSFRGADHCCFRCHIRWFLMSSSVFRRMARSVQNKRSSLHATSWLETLVFSPGNSPKSMNCARWSGQTNNSQVHRAINKMVLARMSLLKISTSPIPDPKGQGIMTSFPIPIGYSTY